MKDLPVDGGSASDASLRLLMGCIADDYTGATDVVSELQRHGLQTVLHFGIPEDRSTTPPCDAVVLALKTRSAPAAVAIEVSLRAKEWIESSGAKHTYFKYCSTFDSTSDGNIGPVADALSDASDVAIVAVCPASPLQARTVYSGYLFVQHQLLEDSPMRHHSTTPMADSSIKRLLEAQSAKKSGNVWLAEVRSGPDAIRAAMRSLVAEGNSYAVLDAVDCENLNAIAEAVAHASLASGGAPLAGAIGGILLGSTGTRPDTQLSVPTGGKVVILAGSCSKTTREQVAVAQEVYPWHRLDPVAHPDPSELKARALEWLDANLDSALPLLVFSSAAPEEQKAASRAGGDLIGIILERVLGELALYASQRGRSRVIVAGGETAGAVIDSIGVKTATVGGEQERGVPWLKADTEDMWLLLKSGNYGSRSFLVEAAEVATI